LGRERGKGKKKKEGGGGVIAFLGQGVDAPGKGEGKREGKKKRGGPPNV